MKTPEEKYLNDPAYHALVDMIRSLIEKAEFTPSEIREAATYACIRYEMTRSPSVRVDDSLFRYLEFHPPNFYR